MLNTQEVQKLKTMPVAFQTMILEEVRNRPEMADRAKYLLKQENPTGAMKNDLLKVSANVLDPQAYPESRNAWGVYRSRFAQSWKRIVPGVLKKSGMGISGLGEIGDLGQWAELISAVATVAVSAGAQAAAAKKAKTEEKRAKRAATAEEKKAAEEAMAQATKASQAVVSEASKAIKVTETEAQKLSEKAAPPTPEAKSKTFLIGGSILAVLVGGGILLAMRKKR